VAATLSLDLETDYGSGRSEALNQIDRVVDLLAELHVPWTAFVEGHFFESRPRLVRRLCDAQVDVQLHCYDHGQPGDTPGSLARSAAAYADLLGRRPEGYRAHTYRLTPALFDALLAEGFFWDSSLMRAFAQGRNPHSAFRRGDYFLLAGRLVEFPVSTWRGLPIAFNHTHVLLAKTPGEFALRTLFGTTPLVVYNCHMADLVRCGSLRAAKRTPIVRLLHWYLWSTQGDDTFATLRRVVRELDRSRYPFVTMSDLYRSIQGLPWRAI
jgi:hypothetical protein